MTLIVDFPSSPRSRSPALGLSASAPELSSLDNRLRVAFSPEIEIRHVKDLSRTSFCDDLWFTRAEMKRFKYATACTVRRIELADLTVAQYAQRNVRDTHAFLGLENYFASSTRDEIVRRRRAVRDAVLDEQARQVAAGIERPEDLSRVAARASEVSRKRARIVALIHADK
ncbi:hypothetical protein ACHAWF_013914 [Thalassiosira exigua]